MKKVFRFYDNDDDGSISKENIWQAGDLLEMESELNEQNVEMMIEMADRRKKGELNMDDFLELMSEIGLIPEEVEEEEVEVKSRNSSFERIVAALEEER